ncbi:sulfatase [Akkermansiaceae bacterium]|nr:sulfatase [Akkermansiaceae bacterium]
MKLLLTISFLSSAIWGFAAEKPNIVLLFVDDWGWSDMGFRNSNFESPNIDQFAKESMSFEQAYIACPTCSPSRATLLTGKHPARLKIVRHIPGGPKYPEFDKFGRTETEFNLWESDPAKFPCRNWLPLEEKTYAEALKEQGYYNMFVGKWHLGHEKYHPIHQGFDKQVGTSNWGHPKGYNPPYFKNSQVMKEQKEQKERYLTDKLTDESVKFIEGYDKEQPFMLSLWYYTVHGPHDGRKDYVEHFKKKGLTGKELHYAAMVKSLDDSVGRVREVIEKKGIEKETIIILLSDQGGYFENKPFRGGKRSETLFEGGARVPFFINWPGVTEAGAKNQSIVQTTDLFSTFVEMAGGKLGNDKLQDGVSLLTVIRNNSLLKRGEPIVGYRAYEELYASVREGAWKLMAYRSGKLELFNIETDPAETADVAKEYEGQVSQLKEKLIAWEKEMQVEKYSGVQ